MSSRRPRPSAQQPASDRLLLAERCAAVTCAVLAAVIGIGAESLVSTPSVARPGAIPPHGALWIAAAVLGAAAIGWAAQSFRRTTSTPIEAGPVRDAVGAFVVMVVGAWLVTWLGLLIAAGLTYVGLLLFYRDRNWLFIATSTIAYVCAVYYGLAVALRVPLPTSPILDLPF